MSIARKILLVIYGSLALVLAAGVTFVAYVNREPSDLKRMIGDPQIEKSLVAWVSDHETEISRLTDAMKPSSIKGQMHAYPLQLKFDWSLLGFDPADAQLTVIKPMGGEWVAVKFARYPREGILVARAKEFGVSDKVCVSVKGRLAVYFVKRD